MKGHSYRKRPSSPTRFFSRSRSHLIILLADLFLIIGLFFFLQTDRPKEADAVFQGSQVLFRSVPLRKSGGTLLIVSLSNPSEETLVLSWHNCVFRVRSGEHILSEVIRNPVNNVLDGILKIGPGEQIHLEYVYTLPKVEGIVFEVLISGGDMPLSLTLDA